MTHEDLVEIGKKWLAKPWSGSPQGGHGTCSVIISEMTSASRETPDVIGWHGRFSTLIECKCSRSDFKADAKKYFRKVPEGGLGFFRYYLAPKDLIKTSELPEGWGLIGVNAQKTTRVIRPSEPFYNRHESGEIIMLLSLLSRLQAEPGLHAMIRSYSVDGNKNPKATVGLLKK